MLANSLAPFTAVVARTAATRRVGAQTVRSLSLTTDLPPPTRMRTSMRLMVITRVTELLHLSVAARSENSQRSMVSSWRCSMLGACFPCCQRRAGTPLIKLVHRSRFGGRSFRRRELRHWWGRLLKLGVPRALGRR